MTRTELYNIRRDYLSKHHSYKMVHWIDFNYAILNNIMYRKRAGRGSNNTYNEAIIMADTETSKKVATNIYHNHVVAWTISIRAFDMNIVTLYGHRPDTFCTCLHRMINNMAGHDTIVYFHNLSYDWVFLRKFLFKEFGFPDKQLNTKPHYPISIVWENGLIIKDSLILAQRSLDKWAKDMGVEHLKAIGKWDYNKIRTQAEEFTADELEYIEHDTLAGVECIETYMKALNKSLYSLPYTATGIPREEVRNRAKPFHYHDRFLSMSLTYEQQMKMENVYHGGYTHANRHLIDVNITDGVSCYDFASSYPYVMLSERYPMEKFTPYKNCSIQDILDLKDDYAFMFKLVLFRPRLKDNFICMPALQFSKCIKSVNAVLDNGRVLCADYIEIYINELDLEVINSQYIYDKHLCIDVEFAIKEYLPRWFTDYIFELFKDKTVLKGGDKVLYALAKAKLNSLYGMCVQKPIKDTIEEQYLTGEYTHLNQDPEELYEKYLKNYNSILPYQWGVWVTAYAFRNLFKLGSCCGTWVYSDTDSCYGVNWNIQKLNEYNQTCKDKLLANEYGCVVHNGREYWLGVAELDGEYSEFKVQGAKRYCGRSVEDGELHITVAGVPKSGSKCLKDDINNFTSGIIFPGAVTGKQTHTYFYIEETYTDNNGNLTGDSIDLSPCDYLLSSVETVDWENLINDEVEIQVYDETDL